MILSYFCFFLLWQDVEACLSVFLVLDLAIFPRRPSSFLWAVTFIGYSVKSRDSAAVEFFKNTVVDLGGRLMFKGTLWLDTILCHWVLQHHFSECIICLTSYWVPLFFALKMAVSQGWQHNYTICLFSHGSQYQYWHYL